MASTLFSTSIANLHTGVSQQPAALRLQTAAEEMINAWPSVVSGLSKRQPTKFIAKLSSTITENATGYIIDRDPTYRYLVTTSAADLKVYDLAGVEQTVTFPNGKSYLTSTSPIDAFRFVTVGDTTFVLNRDIVSAGSNFGEVAGAGRIDPTTRITFFVTQSIPNSNYNIYINNVLRATITTKNNVDAANAVESTEAIASNLRADLAGVAGYTATQYGSSISLSGVPSTEEIVVQSGSGDKALKFFREEVQSFSDLPPQDAPKRVVRIKGDIKEAGDDYYVMYEKGIWKEVNGYGAGGSLTASTMPHVLVRNTDGTWTFKQHTWINRFSGDITSNPFPSFVGYKIRDIFLYQNRMGLLSEENIIMSETNEYENFFRTTLTTLIDSDPLDFAVLHDNVNILQHAVPYNETLLLFSDQNQFRFTFENYLGPKNVKSQYTTSFNCSRRVSPINIGGSIYFVDDQTDSVYASLLEYYPKDNQTGDDADEVSAPVPEYINGQTKWAVGSPSAKTVFMTDGSSTLWGYKYYWAGDRKVQNSWGKWTFADCTGLYWGGIAQDKLYLIVKRSDGVSLETISLQDDVFTTQTDYQPLLDRFATLAPGSATYSSVTDLTTITLPYSTSVAPEVISTEPGTSPTRLQNIRQAVTVISATQVAVTGNIADHTLSVGLPYTLYYEFSTPYLREDKGNGQVVVLDGRLQMRYMILEYHDTYYFRAQVDLPARDTSEILFTGQTLGTGDAVLGNVSFVTGSLRIPIMGENTKSTVKLLNDSPYPCYFGSAELLVQYFPKASKRL